MTVTVSRVLPGRRLRRRREVARTVDRNVSVTVYPPWSTVIGHSLRRHVKDAAVVLATAAFLIVVVAAGFWLLTVRS
jgi:hypothetical protein